MVVEPDLPEATEPAAVALALGSNLGAREANLVGAIAGLLQLLDNIRLAAPFETRPQPPLPHPDYLNTVLIGDCELAPEALLAEIKQIERALGRGEAPRNAPRIIDIDLLLYGSLTLAAPELTIPHPRLRERHFVLVPLASLAADWKVPPDGRSVSALLADLGTTQAVKQVAWTMPPLGEAL
jgi:2-amino-4-hydroxy-6-hydroxymethyldihydropteridine diphosphokinase